MNPMPSRRSDVDGSPSTCSGWICALRVGLGLEMVFCVVIACWSCPVWILLLIWPDISDIKSGVIGQVRVEIVGVIAAEQSCLSESNLQCVSDEHVEDCSLGWQT